MKTSLPPPVSSVRLRPRWWRKFFLLKCWWSTWDFWSWRWQSWEEPGKTFHRGGNRKLFQWNWRSWIFKIKVWRYKSIDGKLIWVREKKKKKKFQVFRRNNCIKEIFLLCSSYKKLKMLKGSLRIYYKRFDFFAGGVLCVRNLMFRKFIAVTSKKSLLRLYVKFCGVCG